MNHILRMDAPRPEKPAGRLLSLKEVIRSVGLSKSTIYALIKADKRPFPAPIKILGRSLWLESEVERWKQDCIRSYRGK